LPGSLGIAKPKYGASREMSQSRRPASNHSLSLAFTDECATSPSSHPLRNDWNFESVKKKCTESFITGGAPETTDRGFLRSVGEYAAPQFSQLSPYWSGVPQRGHSPLM
jgi:hypothetical protein